MLSPKMAALLLREQLPLILNEGFLTTAIGNQHVGIPIYLFDNMGIKREELLKHDWYKGKEWVWSPEGYQVEVYEVVKKEMEDFSKLNNSEYAMYKRKIENGMMIGG
jgi:hypothetical protein